LTQQYLKKDKNSLKQRFMMAVLKGLYIKFLEGTIKQESEKLKKWE